MYESNQGRSVETMQTNWNGKWGLSGYKSKGRKLNDQAATAGSMSKTFNRHLLSWILS